MALFASFGLSLPESLGHKGICRWSRICFRSNQTHMHTHTRRPSPPPAPPMHHPLVGFGERPSKPALLQLAFVYGSQSTFQLPTTAKDISSPIPALRPFTLYHQMLHPYSDSVVLYAHRNLAKQKEQVRFHPKETTEF